MTTTSDKMVTVYQSSIDELTAERDGLAERVRVFGAALTEMLESHANLYRSSFGHLHVEPDDDIVRQRAKAALSGARAKRGEP